MNRSNLPYRKNCEGYLVFGENLIGRNTEWNYIDFPGGGVDDGEDLKEALKREAFEEAGVILKGELKEVGVLRTIWPDDWAKNEKQQKRFERYKGDEMHFFTGEVKELVQPKGDGVEEGWNANERMMPIEEAIKLIESYRPFPKELKEYYDFKLKILNSLLKKIKAKMNRKVMAIIKSDKGNYLLLKTNPKWLKVNEWFVVTGSVEGKETEEEAVKREVKEETGLKIISIKRTSYFCEYEWPKGSGKMHHEHAFLVTVKAAEPQLSGEHLEYKWLSKSEFLKSIAWQGDKKELERII